MSDFEKRFEQESKREFARAYVFTGEGDMLIGTLVGLDMGYDAKYTNEHYPIVEIEVDKCGQRGKDAPKRGDRVAVHCFHAALRSQFQKENPGIGETIGIRHLGKRASKVDGNTYVNYRVMVDRPEVESEFTWDVGVASVEGDEA